LYSSSSELTTPLSSFAVFLDEPESRLDPEVEALVTTSKPSLEESLMFFSYLDATAA
jgi:hypothetical protein